MPYVKLRDGLDRSVWPFNIFSQAECSKIVKRNFAREILFIELALLKFTDPISK